MKNLLIFLVIAVVIVAGYMLLKKSNNKGNTPDASDFESSQTEIGGRRLESPSASEGGTYKVNEKASSISFTPSMGDAVEFDIKSGELLVQSGDVVGGKTIASSSRLNKLPGFESVSGDEVQLEVKSLVFERARSTSENLVYRTDAELTVNGKTYPVSFDSMFRYQAGEYYITGQTTPDWKNWGISLPSGQTMSINIVILATK
jgi:hypothetical protein